MSRNNSRASRYSRAHLQILFPVENNSFCFDFSVFDIHFVTTQNNRDAFTNAYQVSMPVGDIFVSDAGRNVEHNYGALSLDIVSVSKSSKFFLTGCIPYVKSDRPTVCVEYEGMHFNAKRSYVSFLELSSQMSFDECGLASASVPNQDAFECGHIISHFW